MTLYTVTEKDQYANAFSNLRQVKRDLHEISLTLHQTSIDLPTDDRITGELAFAAHYTSIALLHLLKARSAMSEAAGETVRVEPAEVEETTKFL